LTVFAFKIIASFYMLIYHISAVSGRHIRDTFYYTTLFILCLVCASCIRTDNGALIQANGEQTENNSTNALEERPDGTLMWKGFELTREDYFGRANDVFVPVFGRKSELKQRYYTFM